jgi:hypothetical protein
VTDLTPPGADSAPASDGPLSIREAADALSSLREQRTAPEPTPTTRAPDGRYAPRSEPAPETGDEPATAPLDETSGVEDQQQPDPAETPSIEPPRSWTKEDKAAFLALPPEVQQRVAERERAREVEIRRGQNETAEQRKAAEAERRQLEAARQQYEAALPQLLNEINTRAAAEFADIKTWDDVQNLARSDWPRYVEWDAAQKRSNALKEQIAQTTTRQRHEEARAFAAFVQEQDRLFLERAPELNDPAKAQKTVEGARNYLTEEVGFTTDELAQLWDGGAKISLRDHRLQTLIRDGLKAREARMAAREAPKKPLPPVQRPGTAPAKGEAQQDKINSLSQKLERAKSTSESIKLMAELMAAKRAAKR